MDLNEKNIDIPKFRKLDEMKNELHELIRNIIIKTDLEEIDKDDYSDTINFSFGDCSICSVSYYQQLVFYDETGCEYDLEYNFSAVKELLDEINDRYYQFEKRLKNMLLDEASNVFIEDLPEEVIESIKIGKDIREE